MPRTRILLADPSASLCAVVEAAVAGHADLLVVGSARSGVDVLLRAGEVEADVVILGTDREALPAVAERLVDEYRGIGVLAVDTDRGYALVYQMRPEWDRIDDLTPAGVVDAIRRADSHGRSSSDPSAR